MRKYLDFYIFWTWNLTLIRFECGLKFNIAVKYYNIILKLLCTGVNIILISKYKYVSEILNFEIYYAVP